MLPLIKMPVREPVSSYSLEASEQFDFDLWFEFHFAVEVTDDGFQKMAIDQGDILLFKECSWPDRNDEVVLACYEGESYYLRVLNQLDIYGRISLRGTGDVIPLTATQDSILIKGVCHYFLKKGSREIRKINTLVGDQDW